MLVVSVETATAAAKAAGSYSVKLAPTCSRFCEAVTSAVACRILIRSFCAVQARMTQCDVSQIGVQLRAAVGRL